MREYLREWSGALGRDMEALRFGASGLPLLVFPTSMGRFYQWEDFGMLEALRDKIEAGHIQLWCVDSVDDESWYARARPPRERVLRHLAYERYVLDELLPRLPGPPVAVGLLEFVDDVVDELGSRQAVEYMHTILRDGTSADRQLRAYRETSDLKAVVDHVAAETIAGVPVPA